MTRPISQLVNHHPSRIKIKKVKQYEEESVEEVEEQSGFNNDNKYDKKEARSYYSHQRLMNRKKADENKHQMYSNNQVHDVNNDL
ncbi:hypothetical protein RhiirA4_480622 [Rhizophagus irregularis]|uniref:Uncharacterized protein n=1 Tax=Rhizophagus irregularis TaxID=588596 RepID=A0A2I1HI86_9GLOM|nr:hypothetical protein RhiirA4_480622 [Rhizophagus irregularis]